MTIAGVVSSVLLANGQEAAAQANPPLSATATAASMSVNSGKISETGKAH